LAPVFSFAPGAAYKVSKAALNMLTRQYAVAFADDGITFIAISPGVSTVGSIKESNLMINSAVH
jgi:NAD(P)-dependent dehydrogenase (short-subunit alcohol dehydrogenase family)